MTETSILQAERVLIFAPIGRDAPLTCDVLSRDGINCTICGSIDELCTSVEEGAGVVLLTEEALGHPQIDRFLAALEHQPPWSDISTLVFAGNRHIDPSPRTLRIVEAIRNVTLLDRPIRIAAVLSSVRAALRSRRRQYEVRDLLVALHRARIEAEDANRLKDEFLATLSHELRTPLNAILGWTNMLRHGQLPPERYAYVFEVLERNAQSQALLIADVLDVSRIITGKLQLALEDVALVDVIGSALDGVRPAAASKGVQIRVEVEDGLALRADSQRLQQIVWNLASNAVKFTPPGGRVEVAARRHGNIVELTVSDTGIGIAPSFLPFVFDRFRQADQSTTRVHGGLGLGLAIVRHLTELHGGTVSVRSDGSDRGATFQVGLPALAKTAVASRAGMGPAETGTFKLSWPGIRILVVDDDPSTRELLAALLGGAGAEVTTAVSAREAQELLQEFPIDLLIADLGMPGKDGFALMSQIRASSETWRTVRAIALSAYADTRSKERALDAGFTRFVGKPVRPQDLLRTVNELVEAPA